MSRIGKMPITIPQAVKVELSGRTVNVEGPKGKSSWTLPDVVSARIDAGVMAFSRKGEDRRAKAMHGLARALVANMVVGVSEGFKKQLEIQGVGFKAAVKGPALVLSLGFSHPIEFPIPAGIKITVSDQHGKVVPEGTFLTVEGSDRQLVGAVAAEIRRYYPAEPYKGKGVRYQGEQIARKEGKTAQGR